MERLIKLLDGDMMLVIKSRTRLLRVSQESRPLRVNTYSNSQETGHAIAKIKSKTGLLVHGQLCDTRRSKKESPADNLLQGDCLYAVNPICSLLWK